MTNFMTIYDEFYDVFMSMEQRDGNCHKMSPIVLHSALRDVRASAQATYQALMSQIVVNCRDVCRKLSWRFFPVPFPPPLVDISAPKKNTYPPPQIPQLAADTLPALGPSSSWRTPPGPAPPPSWDSQ